MEWDQVSRYIFKALQDQTGQKSNLFDAERVSLSPTVPIETTFTLDTYTGADKFLARPRGEFRPRQLPRAVDLKGRLLSCQNY